MIDASTSTEMRHEIGAHRKRVEDPRLLRGEGRYVEDLPLSNVAEVAFLRSAYAHARLVHVDVEAARRAPGVLAVWTGEQVRDVPRIPSRARGVTQHHLSPLPPLADGVVTMTGYPLAAVVATDIDVEALCRRPVFFVAQMPLADVACGVAIGLEYFSDRRFPVR